MYNALQFPYRHGGNARTEIKNELHTEIESLSGRASPSNAFPSHKRHKSPIITGAAGNSKNIAAGKYVKVFLSCTMSLYFSLQHKHGWKIKRLFILRAIDGNPTLSSLLILDL